MTGQRTLIMGVLNVTPDSFSDGGSFTGVDAAVARGLELASQGADIIDVGGESTRPGAVAVSVEEEQLRVLPVVRALADAGLLVSIDTIHAATAAAAVAAGAKLINDVSGGTHDSDMLDVAAAASAEHGVRVVLGHWRGVPDPAERRSQYLDVVTEVRHALAALAEKAVRAGIHPEHIVLDPGLGFDKTGPQGWQLLARLDELLSLGYPVLIGASRKRMLAEALAAAPAVDSGSAVGQSSAVDPVRWHERDLGTAVVSAMCARAGAWGVRVHDVAGTAQALAVEAAWRGGEERSGEVRGGEAHGVSARNAAGAGADLITLTGLEVFAHHGVFDFERERGQRFLIDAELAVNFGAAAAGDVLERTVHYGELAEALRDAAERDPVDLIETVAVRLADTALGFPGALSARITVHKPDAPIAAVFADVSVTVVRESQGFSASGAQPGSGAEQ